MLVNKWGWNFFQSNSIISISDIKILYCSLIIFWLLKKQIEILNPVCVKYWISPNSQSNLFAGEVSGWENYSNLFTTSPATYLLLLLLRQPISKLDTHALSLSPCLLGPPPCETSWRSVDSSKWHTALPTYCDSAKSEWWRPVSVSGLVW